MATKSTPPAGAHGAVSECSVCFLVFCGVGGFDAHRTGKYGVSRRCLTVPEMEAKGFTRCDLERWVR